MGRPYNGPGTSDDLAYALKVDASGNVFVTGEAFFDPGTGGDYATIKYSPSGVEQWVRRYNGRGNTVDVAFALALDESGDVYVTGGSRGADLVDDFATVKYSASGVEQWTIRHSDEGEIYDIATAIGVDRLGGVYVTGSSTRLGGRLITTVKYAEVSVSGAENEAGVPVEFALMRSWPNPFNAMTVIRYSLAAKSHTTLKVYNARGEEVATLVDGIHDAGYGMVEWDATGIPGIPNGVYFCRLQAGGFIETKRLVLLR